MRKIQMVDLHAQYQNIKSEVDNAIQGVIDSTAFINGPQVKDFADNLSEYLSAEHAIPCANGTDALQIALMALDLKPGDEVITPDFTFISTVEVVKLLGLKPVLVDVDKDTFLINIQKIENAITKKTKAIVPVHLFGQCVDMYEINALAEKYGLAVIEDTAQAIGSDFSRGDLSGKAGTLGDIGCTSFFPSKNLGCFGDGGAIYTNNADLAGKIKSIANHGSEKKYYHSEVGVNSRLDTLQAAILDVKLKYLDEYNRRRRWAADYYDKMLANINEVKVPLRTAYSTHIFHQYTITLQNKEIRDTLKQYLKERAIPSMIYYPVPMHLQEAYMDEKNEQTELAVSKQLAETVLSLPMHTELDVEQLAYITEAIHEFFN
ncbi:MAG: DegT/DnrJ/EryC1/StrS family aminotransferase [Bacteroidales bacterium]